MQMENTTKDSLTISLHFILLCLFTFSNFFSPYYYLGDVFARVPIILAFATVLAYVMSKVRTQQPLFSFNITVVFLLFVWGFAIYGTYCQTVDIDRSKGIFNYFNKVIVLFLLIIHVVSNMKELKIYVLVLALCSFGNAYKLVHYPIWNLGRAWLKGTAFGGDPNIVTLIFICVMPLLVAWILLARNKILRVTFIYMLFILMLAVVEGQSRGGFLALIVMTFLGIIRLNGYKQRLIATLLVVVFGGGFLVRYAPPRFIERMQEITNPETDATGSAQHRMSAMKIAAAFVLIHPFSKYGLGNHSYLIAEQYGTEDSLSGNIFHGSYLVHNIFLQFGSDLGLIPLITYILFIISIFYCLRRVEKKTLLDGSRASSAYIIGHALFASLCGLLVASFFLAGAYQPFLFYIGGCCVALYKIESR